MLHFRKFYYIPLLLLALWAGKGSATAQALTFDVQAPRVVNVGETFRVTFVANQKVEQFAAPNMDGFTVMAGPAQSSSQSVNIVNGSVTRSVQNSLTYTLRAEKEGKFTIGIAKIRAGNAEAQTPPIAIECVKGNTAAASNAQSAQGTAKNAAASTAATGDDLFLGIAVSKREVYRGEHLAATIKLYAQGLGIAGIENPKMPTFNGFWNQDIEVPKQIEFQRENVNGTVYDAGVLFKQLLFPQQTGEITITPAELDVIVQVRTRSRDIFDDFFGGGYQNQRRSLKSKPVTIRVKDLPAGAPASFSGAVGNFKIESSLSAAKITANSAVTLTLKVSGNGNLKLVNAPSLNFPPDFEVYDTKTTESIKTGEGGATGYRQFEIPIIPRSAGDFEIPAVEFSFFNPATHRYVTLSAKSHSLTVEKDSRATETYTSNESRKSDIKHLGQDIRFIKTNVEGWRPQQALFPGTAWFYLLYFLFLAVFIVLYLVLKKRAQDNKNIVLVKNRKAKKIAKRRLSAAAHLLKMHKTQGFYEELLHAMWGYLSNKLNIPAAELSRQTAQTAFEERQIETAYIETFLSVVDECEFAQYASSGGRQTMDQLYTQAAEVISKLEQRIR